MESSPPSTALCLARDRDRAGCQPRLYCNPGATEFPRGLDEEERAESSLLHPETTVLRRRDRERQCATVLGGLYVGRRKGEEGGESDSYSTSTDSHTVTSAYTSQETIETEATTVTATASSSIRRDQSPLLSRRERLPSHCQSVN